MLDVVNLSLGYYHETPDEADDTVLHDLLQDFADEGIVVVACAGNDATRARFFPAAFAVQDREGLVGVGATNPDDRSVALFSNVGDWVTAHAPGAGIVSTVPVTLSGAREPLAPGRRRGSGAAGRRRPRRLPVGLCRVERHRRSPPRGSRVRSPRRIVDAGSPAHAPSSARSTPPSRSRQAAVVVIEEANKSRFGAKGKRR